MLIKFLSKTSKQLKEHCKLLSGEEKQNLYSEVLNKVKNKPRDSREGIDQLKKLSKMAVTIEETTDSKLLEKFKDDHPLREVSIAYVSGGAKNYLFSLSNSSELYDLEEDREKAIYQAIKSNVDNASRLLEASLRKSKEEGWGIPSTDVDEVETSGNKTEVWKGNK